MDAIAACAPGQDWLAILSRPTLAEFARAFSDAPTLQASVLSNPLVGVSALRAFLNATRTLYDSITFAAEHRAGSQTWLEWQGAYDGRPISGVTILTTEGSGLIARVRIFHEPLDQLTAFAAHLTERLAVAQQGDNS